MKDRFYCINHSIRWTEILFIFVNTISFLLFLFGFKMLLIAPALSVMWYLWGKKKIKNLDTERYSYPWTKIFLFFFFKDKNDIVKIVYKMKNWGTMNSMCIWQCILTFSSDVSLFLNWDRLNIIAFDICCRLISCQISENPYFTLATKLQGSKCIHFHFTADGQIFSFILIWSNESLEFCKFQTLRTVLLNVEVNKNVFAFMFWNTLDVKFETCIKISDIQINHCFIQRTGYKYRILKNATQIAKPKSI